MKTVRTWCIRILMILFTIIFLYPLFWNLMSAFKTNAEYLTDPYALPVALNLDNFVTAWQKANIAAYFGNSIFVTVLSTVLLLLLVTPISYVLARYRFVGSRLISTIYMACIFLQATYIMIPLFLELQAVNGLNNLPVLCLVYAVMQFPFCIFTLQGFMSAVPRDYEESARIDGATNIQLLLRVMVPLAKPGIATITMLSAMGFWNEYPLALVLLTEDAKKTLPIGMANLFEVQKYATDWGALFAGLVIVMIPTIIIYLIGQRYLLQGIGAGGLKG
nr:carbohydrate ABC transporter permease [uncultured Blautia sp.]